MRFNRHKRLEGHHAPYSPSQSHWLRYDDDKMIHVHTKKQAAAKGTRLHAWAKETIDLGIRQPRSEKTLYAYVNDAITYKMGTEVVLYYSDRFYGTADAISFSQKRGERAILRIHDLKTGETPAKIEQLEVYAALFCLEYDIEPADIDFELRIYQSDDIIHHFPGEEDILPIMDKIIHLDDLIQRIEEGEV